MKSNALDRCLWEMHHEGKIAIIEVSPRVFHINHGLATCYAAEKKIVHKNGGVIIEEWNVPRKVWRTKILSLLKMESAKKEQEFRDKEVALF